MYKKIILCLALLLCASTAFAETIDRVAAVVDGEIITEYDITRTMAQYQKANRVPKSGENMKRNVLDDLIDDLLLKHAMEKSQITVDDDDLARAIANVLRQNKMTPEELRADLAAKGISYEAYKQQVAQQIRMIKFTNQIIGQQVKLTDRELREFYDRNKDRFGGSSSTFEAQREKIYDTLYEERVNEAMHGFIVAQRQRAYIDIR